MELRSALVTGASSGIGFAVARVLSEEKFGLTLVGRDGARLAAAADGLADVQTLSGSLADEAFLDHIVARHQEMFGALDVLVNNAGIAGHRAVADITADFLDEQLAVNLRAPILLTAKAMPMLRKAVGLRGSAQVINTASNAGKRGESTLGAYSASKFGVVGFTEALHDELSTSGIRATAICPGVVDTPMADPYRDDIPAHTMIAPTDVAEVVRMTTRLSPACIVPEVVLLRPTEWLQTPQ
ncbi:short-chain dehydrogenase [Mycobacterium sp. MS1601]|uniref:SDR family oxidoreductase n=1 Tax=Mycobacterium sp. MS1601 TaxID=1936029 RepID=UPI0009795B61|nr:SDR family oxidoreductase [Mycobacterium sp. MS1601]AQA02286.1 short-chain dehydrogenase [Mycobacterium sp. MS1601]